MESVKFYSEYDMACGSELSIIIENINHDKYKNITTVDDLIDFYNTLKYLEVVSFATHIESNTSVIILDFKKHLNREINMYIYKSNFVTLYQKVDFIDTEDYFEILDKYKIYEKISDDDFLSLTKMENFYIFGVLKHKNITEKFDTILKPIILGDPKYIELILDKYLREATLYLPRSLTNEDLVVLIDSYINSPQPNCNYLRKIINFPNNTELKIPDKVKLHAKKREKTESEKIFESGSKLLTSVSLSYHKDLNESIKISFENLNTEIKVNLNWIKDNLDYPTLLNNFIYLFNIIDVRGRYISVSKKHGHSPLEILITPTGSHLFRDTRAFNYMEMYVSIIINSYIGVLNQEDIAIENIIEWFFKVYLKDEFSIINFEIYTPKKDIPYFEKCRAILPELDKIFKQYNTYIDNGEIDQELIQISSFSYMTNQIKSVNTKKYVYPKDTWFETISNLLFSDQSGIFYIPEVKEKHKNFFELISKNNVGKNLFRPYQLARIQHLIDENLIIENVDGFYEINDLNLVYVLKELYYEDVINYWHYKKELRDIIDGLFNENKVEFENTLLTRNEQDYFDFYLNRSKFTNSYDIRNRYLHGTNTNDVEKYETDYYSILKLLIIVVLKINDDLVIKNDFEHN